MATLEELLSQPLPSAWSLENGASSRDAWRIFLVYHAGVDLQLVNQELSKPYRFRFEGVSTGGGFMPPYNNVSMRLPNGNWVSGDLPTNWQSIIANWGVPVLSIPSAVQLTPEQTEIWLDTPAAEIPTVFPSLGITYLPLTYLPPEMPPTPPPETPSPETPVLEAGIPPTEEAITEKPAEKPAVAKVAERNLWIPALIIAVAAIGSFALAMLRRKGRELI
jgi:hypothetical protein